MPKLIALRPQCGDYGPKDHYGLGTVFEGQVFETDDQTAESLEARGLAMRVHEPSMVNRIVGKMLGRPENKMQPVVENKAYDPVITASQASESIVEPAPPPVYASRFRPPLRQQSGRR